MSKKLKRKGPVDYDPPFESEEPVNRPPQYKMVLVYLIDQDEVNSLVNASSAPVEEQVVERHHADYEIYTPEEADQLVNDGVYKRKKSRKKK